MLLLFLDFDGVLHVVGRKQPLEHLPRLENVLRDYPACNVVVTSSWTELLDIDDIREAFSPDLRQRVIAILRPTRLELRQTSIKHFLSAHCGDAAPVWVVLDDEVTHYDDIYPHLIECDPEVGFDDEVEAVLRTRLESLSFVDNFRAQFEKHGYSMMSLLRELRLLRGTAFDRFGPGPVETLDTIERGPALRIGLTIFFFGGFINERSLKRVADEICDYALDALNEDERPTLRRMSRELLENDEQSFRGAVAAGGNTLLALISALEQRKGTSWWNFGEGPVAVYGAEDGLLLRVADYSRNIHPDINIAGVLELIDDICLHASARKY